MDHVIKIAHPSRGTTVLAADTEKQALIWIKQINLYAQGITPSETHSFLDHPTMLSSNTAPNHSSCSSSSSIPATPVRSIPNPTPADLLDVNSKQLGTEIQDDSGFSAPVSSGSEGNSGDGMVGIKAGQPGSEVLISQCLSSSTLLFSSRSTNGDCIAGIDSQPSRSYQQLSDSTTLSNDIYAPPSITIANTTVSTCNTISNSFQSSVRREGFLSSVRRKVESLSSIRRTRKSLPQTSVCASKLTMPKANSSADLHMQSTHASVPVDQTALCKRFPSHVTTATDRLGTGFDWAQLEGASRLFSHSDWSVNPSISSPKTRPHSFVSISSHPANNDANVSQIVNTSKHGPLINLHSSTNCTVIPENNNRIIVSGEALIAIPGRIPWTTRWCCLRSGFLDVYLSAGQPPGLPSTFSNSRRSSHTPAPSQSNDPWPVFSLTLEPGQVELGLAGDKHYKAALRLAVPKQSTVSLLFNAPDKLQMGTWIRGFIEALAEPSVERTIASVKSSVSRSEVAEYDAPESAYSYSSTTRASDCRTRTTSDPRMCELTEDEASDIQSINMRSVTLYDEVCSTQYTCPAVHNIPDPVHKRRWSSPLLPVQSAGRLCHFSHQLRLQSQQHSLPPSETEPVTSHTSTSRWYIPPPSRRLLSQPLPPLPSVGPSGAESMAGTIDSSHASSSLTPEDEDDAASLHSANSVPDFSCLARSATHQTSKSSRRRVRVPQRLHVPPTHCTPLSSPNMSWQMPQYSSRRRHSSLGSLGDHHQTLHPVPDDLPIDEYWCPKELQFREGSLIANAQICCADASTSTTSTFTHSGYTLVSEDDSSHVVAHSRGTSTTHVGFPSDLSLPCSDAADYDVIPWKSQLCPPSWPEDVGLTKSVNHAAARRSVSCVTDTKSFTGRQQSLDPRVVATLPARRECDLPSQTQTTSDAVVFPIATGMVLSTGATTSLSSNSSRTATSSGVALTAGSFSSISTPPFGSSGTARPSSTAISWPPPPPTLTEEHEALEIEAGESCRPTDDRIGAVEFCVSANESKQQERSVPHEIEEPLGLDTTPLPRSSPIRPPLRRANTTTGSGGDDAKVPANVPTVSGLHYSPNNASLILVATQLEEVQHGATKLRSRQYVAFFDSFFHILGLVF
ncbi:hypothetical protein P879_03600 [Paragonimus westermani]|uniref:PH domain-containing protein n=1 Tax=Paragonimus westermani TaxID=34504 RepID=A0A8T0E0D0_9TREM|nr:hypothetical protein P879_03600 [Paragonimus westermani]